MFINIFTSSTSISIPVLVHIRKTEYRLTK